MYEYDDATPTYFTCQTHDKRAYRSRKRARAAARRLNEPGMRAYRCEVNRRYFHIGHIPLLVRRGYITSAEWFSLTKKEQRRRRAAWEREQHAELERGSGRIHPGDPGRDDPDGLDTGRPGKTGRDDAGDPVVDLDPQAGEPEDRHVVADRGRGWAETGTAADAA